MNGRVLVVDDSATVRKIVSLVLNEAGYDVTAAADGHEALEIVQRNEFELVLVDFVMPRLNGYQLTQAIRSISHLRTLPIVLMSVKAEQIGERFMQQTGALDAITKPFSPDALLAVVGHAIARKDAAAPSRTLVSDDMRSHPSILPPMPFGDDGGSPEHTVTDAFQAKVTIPDVAGVGQIVMAQVAAAQRVVEALARAVQPAVADAARSRVALDERAVAEAIGRALGPAELAQLARALRVFDPDLRGAVALEGSVALAPLGELLQMLRLQGQTGVLVVSRKGSEVSLAFRDGRIDLAVARNVSNEFLLGRYLLADRLVTRDAIDRALAARAADGRWLGEQLLRAGQITAEDLERALTRQTSEVIFEMLRWPDGSYRFERGVALPEADGARLGLPVESLVLEGFRRVDEWRVIEQEVSSFDEVLARDEAVIEAVGGARLAREEQLVLSAVDGARTVREVVGAVAMNSFDACKILYRLLRSRLVRRRAS